jgi:Mlc titration factor MtfA (ptsG expression regulator)
VDCGFRRTCRSSLQLMLACWYSNTTVSRTRATGLIRGRGRTPGVLDHYGATKQAEFFAVAMEAFLVGQQCCSWRGRPYTKLCGYTTARIPLQ